MLKVENNQLIKKEGSLVQRISNVITVTNKLLALAAPQLIPYRKGDKWGFCTPDKKIVIDCVYDNVTPFEKGLACVEKEGIKSYINKQGVIKPDFTR